MSLQVLGNIGIADSPIDPMKYNPDKYHRRSIRLNGYNYSSAGFYFITICTHQRICLFGNVEESEIHPSKFGQIATARWQEIPQHFSHVALDEFVIMPNHIHGILTVNDGRSMALLRSTRMRSRKFSHPIPRSISTVIGSFKSITTRQINEIRNASGCPVWQGRFYDHIIRDRGSLDRIRQYIRNNPLTWQVDKLYSEVAIGDGGLRTWQCHVLNRSGKC